MKISSPCAPAFRIEAMLHTRLVALLCAFTAVGALAAGKDQARADVRKSANSTLDRLYKLEPSAR